MKPVLIILTLICSFLMVNLYAQGGHYWQREIYKPKIYVTPDDARLAILTYDRLSVWDLKTSDIIYNAGFIYNDVPKFLPERKIEIANYTDNFNLVKIIDEKRYFWRLNLKDNKWEDPNTLWNRNHTHKGFDYKGRLIAFDKNKKSFYLTEHNGSTKNIGKGLLPRNFYIMPGGKFGYYKDGKYFYLYNFTNDNLNKLPFKNTFIADKYPDYNLKRISIYDKKNYIHYNPYTNKASQLDYSEYKNRIPAEHQKCEQKEGSLWSWMTKTDDYYYNVEIDKDYIVNETDYAHKPYKVVQYAMETCEPVQEIHFSIKEEEMATLKDFVKNGIEAKRLENDVAKADKDLKAKKHAQELSELYKILPELGNDYTFNWQNVSGFSMSKLSVSKTLFPNKYNSMSAIGYFKNCNGYNLMVLVDQSYSSSKLYLARLWKGKLSGLKYLEEMPLVGNKLGAYVSVSFKNSGSYYTIRTSHQDIYKKRKSKTKLIYANCYDKW
ncbi:hypothetical protein [Winogradskyella luteola]|uniref:Uncharacterized protein n=1 Tax=Winogradskyella luteola TaxID=2828330 RepID=A0A9X1FBA5_9FLAO|nr:hypothetical protein [Winogradskyella luteola]MBV7270456.1 hypothetical protein [Winogradskyella luteola]